MKPGALSTSFTDRASALERFDEACDALTGDHEIPLALRYFVLEDREGVPIPPFDLGTVVHLVDQTQTIVPGHEDAYFKLIVPNEAVSGAGDEVIDFSGLFEAESGAGLSMEVLDANDNVLGSGERFPMMKRSTRTVPGGPETGSALRSNTRGSSGGGGTMEPMMTIKVTSPRR